MTPLLTDAVRADEVLRRGGLVLLRTDIGYGLVGCSASAVARIYELKGRPPTKPCVTVANAAILRDVASLRDERLGGWIAQVGRETPIAVVTRVRPESALLAAMPPYVREHATSDGTIATFHSAGHLVTLLAEWARFEGRVVVGSSANASSTGNNYRLADVPESIRSAADLVIDHGEARYANPERKATTMLDLENDRFLREGINHALIRESWWALKRDVLAPPAERGKALPLVLA